MVVPPLRAFLVGPVQFGGPCASQKITMLVLGAIVAPPAGAWTWSIGKADHWLMFYRADGLTVTGNGVLDGNGQSWWIRRCTTASGCVRSAPTALLVEQCNNLELSGFTSKNSPQMHVAVLNSISVHVEHLTIIAPRDSPNTDGIHIGHCTDVHIMNSNIGTGDDCVSISSGSRFVTVHGIVCGPGHGVSIGSLGKNGAVAAVEYIEVSNVHFFNTLYGARIKTWQGGEGYAKSISFTDIVFINVENPVLITQFYRDSDIAVQGAVAINNITYSGLIGTSRQPTAVDFDCSTAGSCTEIHVNNMRITGPLGVSGTVAHCQNVQGDTSGYGAAGIIVICAGILLLGLLVAADEDVFNVACYGATGDGTTDDTEAFVAAWTAACGAGLPSVTVHVPAGWTFLVGPVAFQGPCAPRRITVKVMGNITAPAADAWTGGKQDYWLMFYRVDGLTVTGKGVFDGNGQSWWDKKCIRRLALKLVKCDHMELSHFSSKDSPQMHIVIIVSKSVKVKHLTIVAPGDSPNTDGIHVAQSEDVRIMDSNIGTGDDCVSIGSGSRFVTVRGVTCGPGHGVSIGSLGKHGAKAAVEYVDVRNVHFINTMNGARIKTWEGGQGYARSISFTNIEFTNVDNPVVINQFYKDRTFRFKGAVAIRNVTYTNLKGTSSRSTAVAFQCSTGGSCTEIHVRSMKITGPGGRKAVAQCVNVHGDTSGYIYPKIPCLK
ncbi:hypothetical protein QOZ80_4AG0307390 [Eleusine coracana subsp. coracana]|nr:hypothetical protein QOZ80_4AG0307390 [Eleusine coracana subsp. coracana]